MKIINIILCILVLILAALSAVSSYFLYIKRDTMVKGWDKMAQTVNDTSAELDKGAGTAIAKTLSPSELSHEKYDSLDQKLPALKKQAAEIVKQRDEMVKSIRQIATLMESEAAGTNEDFQNIEKYAGSNKKVIKSIKDIKERQDDCLATVCRISRKVGANMSPNDLKSTQYSSKLNEFDKGLTRVTQRNDVFTSWVTKIAGTAGYKNANVIKGNEYQQGLKDTYAKVNQIVRDLRSTKGQLANAEKQIKNYSNKVSSKDKILAEKLKLIAQKDKEIQRLKGIISDDPTNTEIPNPWPDGGKQVRTATKGSVVEVSHKFGFVVVDLGASARVKQKIGKKINPVNPEVKKGDELVVIRGLDSSSPQFIGKIKLVKIDENCSIANIVAGTTNGDIKVGDAVVFASTI